ncbi:hypothetical protein V6Z11_A08G040200 [Gossypium hirsutum]
MGDLYALDFDGVLCDSCGESSISAVKAAKVRWPDLFDGVDSVLEDWIVDQMHRVSSLREAVFWHFTLQSPQLLEEPLKLIREVRPVVETGYENLLLVRLLVESRLPSIRKSSVAEGLTVEDILENWSKIKPVIMEEWDENRDALIDLFGKVRDEWMDNDLATWIGANRFYPGVPDALKFSSSTIYIVTTKQSRFADALLRELAGVTIPPERIYGLGTGPKVKVLKQLQLRPEHQGMKLHFVEDRLATLKNVIKEPELDGWNLYLGDWGYNTQKEREEAANISRIQLLQLSDFTNGTVLRWVDDELLELYNRKEKSGYGGSLGCSGPVFGPNHVRFDEIGESEAV